MERFAPERARLENGLVVLTARLDTPVEAVVILYNAGSLHESPGATGLAHLTEHMMFRGTPTLPQGRIDEITSELGGVNNAMTTSDNTAYYFVLPPGSWGAALTIEADRMRGLTLDPAAFETERRIALEERRMLDDDPDSVLDEALEALAFERHPYRFPVVGLLKDLERLTLEDLRQYYTTYYRPNNAVLAVAGPIDPAAVVAAAQELFGGIEPAEVPTRPIVRDPDQQAPRHAEVTADVASPRVALGYRCPEAMHPDSPALELLATLLSSGRSSRLYEALVAQDGRVSEVAAVRLLQRDPGLFTISATLQPGVPAQDVQTVVLGLLDRLAGEGPSQTELAKARKLAALEQRIGHETALSLAGFLAFWESLGGWENGEAFERRVLETTADDVVRVLDSYFKPSMRNSAWLIPKGA